MMTDLVRLTKRIKRVDKLALKSHFPLNAMKTKFLRLLFWKSISPSTLRIVERSF